MKTYKQVQSTEKPQPIDVTSNARGVFVRRNIEEVTSESGVKSWTYQEAFLTKNEYEEFSNTLLVNEINGEDNSAEFEVYKNKLNTGVRYVNGHCYKPKWISLYSPIIDEFANKLDLYEKVGGDTAPILALQFQIYDDTGLEENAVTMNIKEIIELWLFLYALKEQFFNEYKESLNKL